MIEGYIRERLEQAFPELTWTENFYDGDDNTGTVYVENGGTPDTYESDLRFPYYMVWVRSSNWDLAQRVSQESIEILNKTRQVTYTASLGGHDTTYEIIFIEATSDANRIGLYQDSRVMEWSSNFKATLRRVNE